MSPQLIGRLEELVAMSALIMAISMPPHELSTVKLYFAEGAVGVFPFPMMTKVFESGEPFAADIASAV
jgi:hypothetical protein